jgi:hypothetical protein
MRGDPRLIEYLNKASVTNSRRSINIGSTIEFSTIGVIGASPRSGGSNRLRRCSTRTNWSRTFRSSTERRTCSLSISCGSEKTSKKSSNAIWRRKLALGRYLEAAQYCDSVNDRVSMNLFEQLTTDEEDHIDFLETQLTLIEQLGVQQYAQKHVGEREG